MRRVGWAAALLLVGCMSTPDLDGGGLPLPYHRPPPHETTEAECSAMGREWIPNAQIAVGGICRTDPPAPPLAIRLCELDAAPAFCQHQHDAGADAADGGD